MSGDGFVLTESYAHRDFCMFLALSKRVSHSVDTLFTVFFVFFLGKVNKECSGLRRLTSIKEELAVITFNCTIWRTEPFLSLSFF